MKLARMGIGSMVLAALVAITSCGGDDGPSPQDACNQVMVQLCNKIFDCYPKELLDASKSVVGLNRGDCATKFQAAQCTPTMVMCDSGTKYQSGNASMCVDGVKALSCTDVMQDNIPLPAICDQVCK